MKLKFEDMRKFSKILKNIPFDNLSEYIIFIPVDSQIKKEYFPNEGEPVVMFEEKTKPSYSQYVLPGLILDAPADEDDKNNSISFGYATTEYSVPFNMEEYIYLQNFRVNLKKEERSLLYGTDYLLVPKKGIMLNLPWDR